MRFSSSIKSTLYLFAQLLILIGLSSWLYLQNQPQTLVAPDTTKFQCVSYAPYYQAGESPTIPETVVTKARILSDLKILANSTDCVRTYSVGQGLDYVPAAAESLGLKVYLGAWISWTESDNLKEIDLATKVANAYPNTVKGIIVGNEVLLRQEQKEADLKRYFQRANKQTAVPITYADVWEFWLKHPTLEDHVDFITVHVLPYWEDNPVNIDHAVAHATGVMNTLQQTFHKDLLIGETGWPSAGKQRNTSTPSNINQARYVREFMQAATQHGWQYNIIEAFDQPWKRSLEGTVGAYWGLFDTHLTPKFSMQLPVSERSDGWWPLVFAIVGAILFYSATQSNKPILRAGQSILGASAGLTVLLQWDYLTKAAETFTNAMPLLAAGLVGWAVIYFNIMASNNTQRTQPGLKWSLLLLLLASGITSILLVHDGRYRNFPTLLFALPTISACLSLWLLNIKPSFKTWRIVPSLVAVIYGLLVTYAEPDNASAIHWTIIATLIALVNWPSSRRKNNNSL